MDYTIPWSN